VSDVPAQFAHLVDDAAVFPPGNMPLHDAVPAHRAHRASEYADLVGGFVISDLRIPDLLEVLDEADDAEESPLGVNVVVSGGAGAIESAARWSTRTPLLELRALELALRDEEDLPHNAQRVVHALDAASADLGDVLVYVEPPRLHGEPSPGWLGALDELGARELPIKLRLGGVDADAVPTPTEVVAAIDAALDRELPFKCTAGLHHAIRHDGQHGFLNVLAATLALLDADGSDAAVALLEETSADVVVHRLGDDVARGRRWFRSFGSCSVLEPHDDLVDLGLL
jgi:hypothetical protein